jgi:putative FmdB family regulatory protein
MPTYDYVCQACNHSFDEFQTMTEPPLKKCPKCGKNKLQRLFGTGAAVLFKGSGFYETDYRSESYKAAAKAEKETATPAGTDKKESSANGKSDTPAPAKSTSKPKSTTKSAKSAD